MGQDSAAERFEGLAGVLRTLVETDEGKRAVNDLAAAAARMQRALVSHHNVDAEHAAIMVAGTFGGIWELG